MATLRRPRHRLRSKSAGLPFVGHYIRLFCLSKIGNVSISHQLVTVSLTKQVFSDADNSRKVTNKMRVSPFSREYSFPLHFSMAA